MTEQKLSKYRYSSNNSGGSWWLSDGAWDALATAGWRVEWVKDSARVYRDSGDADRWLGALATAAHKNFYSEEEAIADFERVTGQSFYEDGCSCCGAPHSIYISGDVTPLEQLASITDEIED